MIELIDVAKHYNTNKRVVKAVDGVTLSIREQEIFGIVGESGAGKSTILRFINLLERPDRGQVKLEGLDMLALSDQELRIQRKSIGMIFQQFNLLHNRTVAENVGLPLTLYNYSQALSVDEVLDFVGLLDKKDQYPAQLSGGQKQRVGIARALISKPKILLCDEPTSALDVMRSAEIAQLLQKAHQEFDMTIVLVTHELNLVGQICDRVALIEEGRLVEVISNQSTDRKSDRPSYHQQVLEVLT